MRILPALLLAAVCTGCAGTPAHYAGSSGSTYDQQRDPPHGFTAPVYDPLSPIKRLAFGNSGQSFTPTP